MEIRFDGNNFKIPLPPLPPAAEETKTHTKKQTLRVSIPIKYLKSRTRLRLNLEKLKKIKQTLRKMKSDADEKKLPHNMCKKHILPVLPPPERYKYPTKPLKYDASTCTEPKKFHDKENQTVSKKYNHNFTQTDPIHIINETDYEIINKIRPLNENLITLIASAKLEQEKKKKQDVPIEIEIESDPEDSYLVNEDVLNKILRYSDKNKAVIARVLNIAQVLNTKDRQKSKENMNYFGNMVKEILTSGKIDTIFQPPPSNKTVQDSAQQNQQVFNTIQKTLEGNQPSVTIQQYQKAPNDTGQNSGIPGYVNNNSATSNAKQNENNKAQKQSYHPALQHSRKRQHCYDSVNEYNQMQQSKSQHITYRDKMRLQQAYQMKISQHKHVNQQENQIGHQQLQVVPLHQQAEPSHKQTPPFFQQTSPMFNQSPQFFNQCPQFYPHVSQISNHAQQIYNQTPQILHKQSQILPQHIPSAVTHQQISLGHSQQPIISHEQALERQQKAWECQIYNYPNSDWSTPMGQYIQNRK